MEHLRRSDNRSNEQIRQIWITSDPLRYAASSILFELGDTKVLCAVNIAPGVPHFLRGKKCGWLNAEYALLPSSTHVRTVREITQMKRSGRSTEISRLIGRVLRTIINFEAIGECTISVDCDVLQADGGTRTASITAASMALVLAQTRWISQGVIAQPFLLETVAAISVGIFDGQVLVDPDYAEDSMLEADFNLIVTSSGSLVEIQGGAERAPVAWDLFEKVRLNAQQSIAFLFSTVNQTLQTFPLLSPQPPALLSKKLQRMPSSQFSLKNRMNI